MLPGQRPLVVRPTRWQEIHAFGRAARDGVYPLPQDEQLELALDGEGEKEAAPAEHGASLRLVS